MHRRCGSLSVFLHDNKLAFASFCSFISFIRNHLVTSAHRSKHDRVALLSQVNEAVDCIELYPFLLSSMPTCITWRVDDGKCSTFVFFLFLLRLRAVACGYCGDMRYLAHRSYAFHACLSHPRVGSSPPPAAINSTTTATSGAWISTRTRGRAWQGRRRREERKERAAAARAAAVAPLLAPVIV